MNESRLEILKKIVDEEYREHLQPAERTTLYVLLHEPELPKKVVALFKVYEAFIVLDENREEAGLPFDYGDEQSDAINALMKELFGDDWYLRYEED